MLAADSFQMRGRLTEAVRRFMIAVSLPVKAISGVTCADDPSKVIRALLLTGGGGTNIHAFGKRQTGFSSFDSKGSALCR